MIHVNIQLNCIYIKCSVNSGNNTKHANLTKENESILDFLKNFLKNKMFVSHEHIGIPLVTRLVRWG